MLRKLLACLALLTGLAAAGTPAQAEVASAIAAQIDAGATASGTEQRASAVVRMIVRGMLAPSREADPVARPVLVAARAPVHLGSDRALE